MCGGDGGSKPKPKPKPTEPQVSPVVQAMIDAVTFGPTGYSESIMENLAMDVRNRGYQGGERPTSGMVQPTSESGTLGPFDHQPRPAIADPLAPLLRDRPRAPASPVKPEDLFMKPPVGTASSNTPQNGSRQNGSQQSKADQVKWLNEQRGRGYGPRGRG